MSDSLYNAHHPRLLFTASDVPALRAKVNDGGYDAEAYDYIRGLVDTVYPLETERVFFSAHDVGISDIPNLGLFAFIEGTADTFALDMGRRVTCWLADSATVDDNAFDSSLRLRAMAIGYDLFFADATPEERGRVVGAIETYVDTMRTGFWYEVWKYRPFLSNFTPMIAGAMGLAAIALDGETDPARVSSALAMADEFTETWLRWQMDPEGSYKEGAMYAGWSMRHLVYYFHAHKRYDGFDWAADPRVRAMENWVAFSLLPVGSAEVNNINDTASRNYPYSRHHAYFDFAQTAWDSGLSLWLWERIAGPYGHDSGRLKCPDSTVLWGSDIAPVHPSGVLSNHFLWRGRGLYYYRTGWQEESLSDDVVFSFLSGKFQGGHAQEDQNSFTLYGYGERFAMDHGFLRPPWESEAHNLTLIDGHGQHNAGGTIGTDGDMAEHLLGGFADYLFGDATRAYTTHSDFNLPDVPFVGMDWSYGYDGGNPVEYAHRRFVVVHGGGVPPYVALIEDMEKDDAVHTYEWRLHTDEDHTVDTAANPIRIIGNTGYMDLHVVAPAFDDIARSLGHFDNGHDDPDATVIRLEHDAIAESFVFLFVPAAVGTATPTVATETFAWGSVSRMEWSGGTVHSVVVNRSGGVVAFDHGNHVVATDAAIAVLQGDGDRFDRHLLTGVTTLSVDNGTLVQIDDGATDVSLAGDTVHVGRADARYRVYAPTATSVRHEDESLPFVRDGDFVVADTTGGPVVPPGLERVSLGVYPNPFRTTTTIVARAPVASGVTFSIYDARGRRVTQLRRDNPDGVVRFLWTGRNEAGQEVASGVYFVRAESAGTTATRKVVVVR